MRIIRSPLRWGHGLSGGLFYAVVIGVSNFDKPLEEIAVLSARQGAMMFFVSMTLVGYVERHWQRGSYSRAVLQVILLPAFATAVGSAVAHWYFTNELRNVAIPFLVSAALNTSLVIALRAGHNRLRDQVGFFWRQLKRLW